MPFYTPPIESESIEIPENTCVPVIASYNTQGQCRPLYFQYACPDGTLRTISIDKVLSVTDTRIFGLSYHCAVTVDNCRRYVDLFYHTKPAKWTIKM